MAFYFCIVNAPGRPVHDIHGLQCEDDAAAKAAVDDLAWQWPGFETVELYQDERLVSVIGNSGLGLAMEPLAMTAPEMDMVAA
ncbi:hypothetical protein JIP62_14860 [Brevundimonas vitis]|uniref:Uncharacterized protein n=1 Tax=Brevundimonas vitisensis TaxID=2800818 RepID=A0ABX7BLT7_9CAUL|nr:hypothetical protein [Brevundimonas vitisensis]QQQ18544.1 hypothetical protein JIP62_14860 [Brevundimonas vitisensis]